MQNPLRYKQYFPRDYYHSRDNFITRAKQQGAVVQQYRSDINGDDNNKLTIDTACLESPGSDKVLIINSGIHGVEGYAGAACQAALLANPQMFKTDSVSILLVHALNPYGFACSRRTNEDNIDVNRNFIDFENGIKHNEHYDRYHSLLYPQNWNLTTNLSANFQLVAELLGGRKKIVQSAITGGQYKHQKGLFFGGYNTSWSALTWQKILAQYSQKKIYLLDIHTGLGKFAQGYLLSHLSASTPAFREMYSWFGDRLSSTADGNAVSSSLAGTLSGTLPEPDHSLVLEFGTRPALSVLNAMRRENWHYWNKPGKHLQDAQKNLKDIFMPENDKWKISIIDQFIDVTNKFLQNISSTEHGQQTDMLSTRMSA